MLSLRSRWLLGALLIQALVLGGIIHNATRIAGDYLMEQAQVRVATLQPLLHAALAAPLAQRDYMTLQEIAEELQASQALDFIAILDVQGRRLVKAGGDHAHPGRSLDQGGVDSNQDGHYDTELPIALGGEVMGKVRVGISVDFLAQARAALSRENGIIALLGMGLAAVLLSSLSWWLTRNLATLRAAVERLGRGEYGVVIGMDPGVNDEFGALAHAFDTMSLQIKTSHQALAEGERRFRQLLETSPQPTLVLGVAPGQPILLANRRFIDLFGYRAEELVTLADWWDRAYPEPETRQGLEARWRQRLDATQESGAPYGQPEESRVRCKNGETRDIECHMAFVGDSILLVMNDLTERMAAETELAAYRQHLEDLVAERTTQLQAARDAAETANRAKSTFLANMSHELRTPLNAILGFAQLMANDANLTADQRRNLDTINRSGRHLHALINDVLDLSRIESGRLSLSPRDFDLHELLASLAEMLALRASEKGLQLRLEQATDLPRYVHGDFPKLRQIVLNLLSNAVKYTRRGEIRLIADATTQAGQVSLQLEVRDTGIGIPRDELERIFQPFYQTAQGIAQGEGTGLGLTICREYARLMQGSLSADSQLGVGSVFRFNVTLPLAEGAEPILEASSPRRLAAGQTGIRVLVAEDQPDNQRLLGQLLEQAGFEVRLAEHGLAAVEAFRSWQPDFIWMDMRMPVMDGYAATRAIRAQPNGQRVPIVALTASVFEEDRQAILAAGCDDMLRKPLETDALFACMARLLSLRFEQPEAAAGQTAAPLGNPGELPETLRQRLAAAAIALDIEAVQAISAEIRPAYPAIADFIDTEIGEYRFDHLVDAGGEPLHAPDDRR